LTQDLGTRPGAFPYAGGMKLHMRHRLILTAALATGAVVIAAATAMRSGEAAAQPMVAQPAPKHLSDTGLYVAGSVREVRPENRPFSPQYPLWSDGATKRRWIYLPPGTAIDAARPDAWVFPPGTKLWKEFSHGRPIETRYIERLADGTWRFAAYVWNEEGTDAVLASADGLTVTLGSAPNGRYAIPSEADCRACHEGAAVPVLGASALQLSPLRDPLAPHAEPRKDGEVDLRELVELGWLRNLPQSLIEHPPRIQSSTSIERAALGYLHGNCGHCHNDAGAQPPVDLLLAHDAAATGTDKVLRSLVGARSRYRAPGLPKAAPLVDPGHPDASVLVARMQSRHPQVQMPPLGTQIADVEALALVERWISELPTTRKEQKP